MSDPFIGEIRIFANSYIPEGWFACDGSLHAVAQYQALYALLGNNFGGIANQTFGVPNLTNLAVAATGIPPGQTLERVYAKTYGTPTVTLTTLQMPSHTHQMVRDGGNWIYDKKLSTPTTTAELGGLYVTSTTTGASLVTSGAPNSTLAPQTIGAYGQEGAHDNQQPTLTCLFGIAWNGVFPMPP